MWKYLLPVLLTGSFILCSMLGYFYLIFPIMLLANVLNVVWGEFKNEEIQQELKRYYQNPFAKVLKQMSAIFLISFVFWAVWFVSSNPMSFWTLGAFTLATGALTGCFLLTLAHDLLHSKKRLDRLLASGLLLAANIPHLANEHIFGHHEQLALEEDASTASRNQSFYNFFRTILIHRLIFSFVNKLGLPSLIWKKILVQNLAMIILQIGIYLAILVFSAKPLISIFFFLIQGFISYVLYEVINYIQHYGLRRKDRNEAISLELSWNSYYKYTNYILYMLPLHSLHHLPSDERNIPLEKLTAGPRVPYLYFGMVFMALIPSLWFKTMNPLIPKT